jgi:hypothetical protein
MISSPPQPKYRPGTPVRVVQHVRVGDRRWTTQVAGVVVEEAIRPVGGMEMGGKARYCVQPTLTLRKQDGELTVVAIDENTEVHELAVS